MFKPAMNSLTFTYKQVYDMHFVRTDYNDSQYFAQYGFAPFHMEFECFRHVLFDNPTQERRLVLRWNEIAHTVAALTIDGEGSILHKYFIKSLDELRAFYCIDGKSFPEQGKDSNWDIYLDGLKEGV